MAKNQCPYIIGINSLSYFDLRLSYFDLRLSILTSLGDYNKSKMSAVAVKMAAASSEGSHRGRYKSPVYTAE
jgi:hypothetical protein